MSTSRFASMLAAAIAASAVAAPAAIADTKGTCTLVSAQSTGFDPHAQLTCAGIIGGATAIPRAADAKVEISLWDSGFMAPPKIVEFEGTVPAVLGSIHVVGNLNMMSVAAAPVNGTIDVTSKGFGSFGRERPTEKLAVRGLALEAGSLHLDLTLTNLTTAKRKQGKRHAAKSR
jgi:hypothetical protein